MRHRFGAALAAAALVLLGAASLHAQTGLADLRYVAPLPGTVTFTTVDTIRNTVSGLPTGELVSTGTVRVLNEMRFAPADGAVTVTAVLKEMQGEMTTPMGSMPMSSDARDPFEFTIGPTGPDPNALAGTMFNVPGPGSDPNEMVASSLALAGLIMVPGRELRLGEDWVDTLRLVPQLEGMEGMAMELTMVTRGTYAADTVVDGLTLNVLRITSEGTANADGTFQGVEITQNMKLSTEETVLWDSTRHIPVSRDATTQTLVESTMAQMGMTMTMEGRSRSITTADSIP